VSKTFKDTPIARELRKDNNRKKRKAIKVAKQRKQWSDAAAMVLVAG